VIAWSVDHRGAVVATTVGVFVLAALGFTHVQKAVFPAFGTAGTILQLRLPEGSAIGASLEAAKQAEAALKATAMRPITRVILAVGRRVSGLE